MRGEAKRMTVWGGHGRRAEPRGTRLRIACVGGGPAGLYFAILMKERYRDHEITVYERNPPA